MTFEEIKELLSNTLPEAVIDTDEKASPRAFLINPEQINPVCELLLNHPKCYFDSLSCLTGLDNGVAIGSMEVIYNLYSIPHHLHLMLKCKLDRENPVIDSVADIWRTANWHEREAFDLLGIHFNNHPDLRRILLPKDWEGHPLRKDYKEQEQYHGITVVYDRKD